MAYTTIKKPSDYFNTKLYTGNGGTNAITGVGFQPDWTWIKGRSVAYGNTVFDVVRGATKRIETNTSGAESTLSTGLTSFDSDGFTLGSSAAVNENSATFASWNWLANGAGSANTAGSINSTVSVNTTAGFSIISYTGNGSDNATVGHGLGVKPDCLIVKNRDDNDGWGFWNKGLGAETQQLVLNLTIAVFTDDIFKSSSSTTVTLGADSYSNTNGEKYIMYAFAEKQGYSKFGSYVGNGNADGPFIYTGFKPAFVLTKNISGTNNWTMCDNKRNTFNPVNNVLNPNVSGAEAVNNPQDFVSNGFKNRATESNTNSSGSTYIYMAFASEPLVGDNPATAR